MSTKKELLEKLDKIDDEELAHMLALVAYRENQEELDQLLQSEEYMPPDEIQMRTFQKKFHKDSQRALHRSKSRVIRWACGIAAAAVFAFAVPISADNVTIFEMVAQVFTDYSKISIHDGYTFTKPDQWTYEFFPLWIPEKFQLNEVVTLDHATSLYFKSTDNITFSFSYVTEWFSNYGLVDENLKIISNITISNQNFPIYSSKDGKYKTFFLPVQGGTIVIDGELTLKELVQIAENIEGIE